MDTPEKEPQPNFNDGAFIEKLDQASPLLDKVSGIYAQTNYAGFDHSIAVAKYSFIRGFNFANARLENDEQETLWRDVNRIFNVKWTCGMPDDVMQELKEKFTITRKQ